MRDCEIDGHLMSGLTLVVALLSLGGGGRPLEEEEEGGEALEEGGALGEGLGLEALGAGDGDDEAS